MLRKWALLVGVVDSGHGRNRNARQGPRTV